MIIEKEIVINKGIENAWKVLGHEFPDAYKWASAIKHSEAKGSKENGAICSERTCSTSMGNLVEKILTYSNNDYSLSYQIVQGMPSMVKYATNSWDLKSIGQNKTKLNMKMDIQIGGVMGKLMKPMMKMKMGKMGDELAEEFKYYVEYEKPHPRKEKANKKLKKR